MELNHRERSGTLSVEKFSIFILILIMTLNYGCRVSYSFSGASVSAAAKTFNVTYFQNRAPVVQPGLSQSLTDALIDKIRAQTKLKYITSSGDANFEGEISDYNTRPLAVAADQQAATNRFTISIKVKFTNVLEPDKSYEQTFSRYEDYSSNLDLSAVESDLSGKIIDLLVEDIFNQAFVNW